MSNLIGNKRTLSCKVHFVGSFFADDTSEVWGKALKEFWNLLLVEYLFCIRENQIVRDIEKIGIKTILLESWLEKKSDLFFKEHIWLCDENGECYVYTKEELDGVYRTFVYAETLDLLIPSINERQGQFRYFTNTLKKQGWEMSYVFERTLLNKGVFLMSQRDQTKRMPYEFMKKLNIRMG
ncbi:hypothetical protein I6N96_12665 [Enterococcus sp. BWM-S5]|uniref:Uncharacterized protein n=1 Tax=Enterococcus larvae TaxID=2794352 RepID=A0ABS4CLX3_9ENTE|nr:hypothetical protein [Enterococcus larvae]MBP1047126.1 hypothetical protein [Enterococcus larvae]